MGHTLAMRREFVMSPVQYPDFSKTLQARIIRVKKKSFTGRWYPTYHLCIKNGPGEDETVILAAQRELFAM